MLWKRIRSGLMFGIACITSPCCTPLIVPLGLALLAGTPAAVGLTAHIGWVYGGLTLLSLISLVLGFRWLGQKSEAWRRIKGATHKQGSCLIGDGEMNTDSTETPSLACNLIAIPADVREEHVITAPQLFAAAQEVHELSNGFAIRFLNEPGPG